MSEHEEESGYGSGIGFSQTDAEDMIVKYFNYKSLTAVKDELIASKSITPSRGTLDSFAEFVLQHAKQTLREHLSKRGVYNRSDASRAIFDVNQELVCKYLQEN